MVQWRVLEGYSPYEPTLKRMEEIVPQIASNQVAEQVWLLEHPPLYTCGTSASLADILDTDRFPVYHAGRGGQVTYHGPGQRICYVMLDLSRRTPDIRAYIYQLEEWLIQTLKHFDINTVRRSGRVGVWVPREDGCDDKIAAIGVRVKKWVTFHGFALNVSPDLTHYSGIIPCGIKEHGITSILAEGIDASMSEVDEVLQKTFKQIFE